MLSLTCCSVFCARCCKTQGRSASSPRVTSETSLRSATSTAVAPAPPTALTPAGRVAQVQAIMSLRRPASLALWALTWRWGRRPLGGRRRRRRYLYLHALPRQRQWQRRLKPGATAVSCLGQVGKVRLSASGHGGRTRLAGWGKVRVALSPAWEMLGQVMLLRGRTAAPTPLRWRLEMSALLVLSSQVQAW